jgi:hypothetical protein
MQIVNLTKDISKLFYVKFEIENYLTEKEEIQNPLELNEFVEWLKMPDTIYCTGDTVIPYSLVTTSKDTYLFTVEEDSKNIDKLISALEEIEYKTSNLIPVSNHDLYINNAIGTAPYFVIKGQPSLNKKNYTPTYSISPEVMNNIMKNLTEEDIKNITENGLDEYRKKLKEEQ